MVLSGSTSTPPPPATNTIRKMPPPQQSGSDSERSVSLDRGVRRRIKRKTAMDSTSGSDDASQSSQASVKAATTAASIPATNIISPVPSTSAPPTPTPMETQDFNRTDDTESMFRLKTYKKRKLTLRDESNAAFTHPGATRPTKPVQATPPIATSNRHAGSVRMEPDMSVVPPQPAPQPEALETIKVVAKRPPPIVIHGHLANHKRMNDFLKTKLRGQYFWRHSANTTTIQVQNRPDWDAVNAHFELGRVDFHTYTPRDEKTHAFILRGLHHEVEVSDLKEELVSEHKVPVKELFTLRGTRFPAYMVVTTNTLTLKEMQARIRYLDHTAVTWERHVNNKTIIQCHRCQQWGHATSNCRAAPRCLKCALNHATRSCTKSRDEPAECVNCGGSHPANSVNCPSYRRRLALLEERSVRVPPAPAMRYVAAPPPVRNAWADRANNRATQQSQQTQAATQQPAGGEQPAPRRPALLPTPAALLRSPPTTSAAPGTDISRLSLVRTEARRTAQLVNLDLLLVRLKDMNDQLERCATAGEKLMVVCQYLESIPDDAF